LTTLLPFSNDGNKSVEGYELGPGDSMPVPNNSWVEGDYFAAMEIPLLAGRGLDIREAVENAKARNILNY
jgi:hypothetical protein